MGDVLHAVDGKNVIGMNKMEVASLLMGPEGSKVRLRFLRQEGNGSCYKGERANPLLMHTNSAPTLRSRVGNRRRLLL